MSTWTATTILDYMVRMVACNTCREEGSCTCPCVSNCILYIHCISMIFGSRLYPADWCDLVRFCNLIHRHVATSHFDLMDQLRRWLSLRPSLQIAHLHPHSHCFFQTKEPTEPCFHTDLQPWKPKGEETFPVISCCHLPKPGCISLKPASINVNKVTLQQHSDRWIFLKNQKQNRPFHSEPAKNLQAATDEAQWKNNRRMIRFMFSVFCFLLQISFLRLDSSVAVIPHTNKIRKHVKSSVTSTGVPFKTTKIRCVFHCRTWKPYSFFSIGNGDWNTGTAKLQSSHSWGARGKQLPLFGSWEHWRKQEKVEGTIFRFQLRIKTCQTIIPVTNLSSKDTASGSERKTVRSEGDSHKQTMKQANTR